MSPVDEGLWLDLMADRAEAWRKRASDATLTAGQRKYAAHRSVRLRSPYVGSRLKQCGRRGRLVQCGCGPRVQWAECRQHLVCEQCQAKRAKRYGVKIRKALEAHAEQAAPGTMGVLVTISVRHSGDIGADRRALVEGWRRFRKAYHRRWGAFPFIGVHEITPGRDALGHPHAHVVCLWPWRDWSLLAELWREACPESTRINFQKIDKLRAAAAYVAKYASKGVQTSDFSPELRARAVAGTYNTRWFFTSVRVWLPFTPCCPACKQKITRDIVTRWLGTDAFSGDWRRQLDLVGVSARGPCEAIPQADERTGARGD